MSWACRRDGRSRRVTYRMSPEYQRAPRWRNSLALQTVHAARFTVKFVMRGTVFNGCRGCEGAALEHRQTSRIGIVSAKRRQLGAVGNFTREDPLRRAPIIDQHQSALVAQPAQVAGHKTIGKRMLETGTRLALGSLHARSARTTVFPSSATTQMGHVVCDPAARCSAYQ